MGFFQHMGNHPGGWLARKTQWRQALASTIRERVAIADSEFRNGSDPRLRIMVHAIRHEQQGGSRLCAVWTAHLQSPTPFETCSPTTSTAWGLERFIGTPVEGMIAGPDGLP